MVDAITSTTLDAVTVANTMEAEALAVDPTSAMIADDEERLVAWERLADLAEGGGIIHRTVLGSLEHIVWVMRMEKIANNIIALNKNVPGFQTGLDLFYKKIWSVPELKKMIVNRDTPIGWYWASPAFHFARLLIVDPQNPVGIEKNGGLTRESLLKMIHQIRTELGGVYSSATPRPHLEEESFAWEVVTKSTRTDFLEAELEILQAMFAAMEEPKTTVANRPQIV